MTQIFDFAMEAIICIRTAPDINYERIHHRARLGENRITMAYQERLNELYNTRLRDDNEIPIYEINGTDHPNEVTRQVLSIINQI